MELALFWDFEIPLQGAQVEPFGILSFLFLSFLSTPEQGLLLCLVVFVQPPHARYSYQSWI
jgi:hypothetical protein